MARVLVLGAGFGGIAAALELRRRLGPGHDVVVVDEGDTFRMGLGNLWLLDGRRKLGEGERPLARLAAHGIEVRRGRVEAIDAASRAAVVDGVRLEADGLVVALGARLDPAATPGADGLPNLYDATGAAAFGRALAELEGGGRCRVLLQVCALPFKCPPAPYEAALVVAGLLRRRGIRGEVHLATPEPHPLPVAPPEVGGRLLPLLEAAGIHYHPGRKPTRFGAREVAWEAGGGLEFDLAAVVPVHKAPACVAASGLAGPSGFIPVDAATMATAAPRVYAVGDVCALPLPNGKPMPKAGVLAEAQGRTAAAHLARELLEGGPAMDFDGVGTCFIELGDGRAIPAEGHFLARPQPTFTFGPATADGLEAKRRFEADRLAAWFGP